MPALRCLRSAVIAKAAELNIFYSTVQSHFRPMEEWENTASSSGKSKSFILHILVLPQDCRKDVYYKNGSEWPSSLSLKSISPLPKYWCLCNIFFCSYAQKINQLQWFAAIYNYWWISRLLSLKGIHIQLTMYLIIRTVFNLWTSYSTGQNWITRQNCTESVQFSSSSVYQITCRKPTSKILIIQFNF